jgi:hypothetical protein
VSFKSFFGKIIQKDFIDEADKDRRQSPASASLSEMQVGYEDPDINKIDEDSTT